MSRITRILKTCVMLNWTYLTCWFATYTTCKKIEIGKVIVVYSRQHYSEANIKKFEYSSFTVRIICLLIIVSVFKWDRYFYLSYWWRLLEFLVKHLKKGWEFTSESLAQWILLSKLPIILYFVHYNWCLYLYLGKMNQMKTTKI